MNVEEGIKMVISGGIVTPKFKQKYIKKDNLAIVVVGNSYLIKDKLKNLTSKNGDRYNFKINEIK